MATYPMGERKSSIYINKMQAVLYKEVSDSRSIRGDEMKATTIIDQAMSPTSPDHYDQVLTRFIESKIKWFGDNLLRDIAQEWLEMLKNHTGEYDTRGMIKNIHITN